MSGRPVADWGDHTDSGADAGLDTNDARRTGDQVIDIHPTNSNNTAPAQSKGVRAGHLFGRLFRGAPGIGRLFSGGDTPAAAPAAPAPSPRPAPRPIQRGTNGSQSSGARTSEQPETEAPKPKPMSSRAFYMDLARKEWEQDHDTLIAEARAADRMHTIGRNRDLDERYHRDDWRNFGNIWINDRARTMAENQAAAKAHDNNHVTPYERYVRSFMGLETPEQERIRLQDEQDRAHLHRLQRENDVMKPYIQQAIDAARTVQETGTVPEGIGYHTWLRSAANGFWAQANQDSDRRREEALERTNGLADHLATEYYMGAGNGFPREVNLAERSAYLANAGRFLTRVEEQFPDEWDEAGLNEPQARRHLQHALAIAMFKGNVKDGESMLLTGAIAKTIFGKELA